MPTTITDASVALYVKTLMGKDTPDFFKLEKKASLNSDKVDKPTIFLKACQALTNRNEKELPGLMKKASHLGIANDVRIFGEKLLAIEKKATLEKYAYTHDGICSFPVDTLSNVIKSDKLFAGSYMKMKKAYRKQTAETIAKRAFDLGYTKLSVPTLAYSGNATKASSLDWIKSAENITKRLPFIKDAKSIETYKTIAKVLGLGAIGKGPIHDGVLKLAETIEGLDRFNNIYPYYGQRNAYGINVKFEDPLTEIFSCQKEAQEYNISLEGTDVPISDIQNLSLSTLSKALGEKTAQEVKTATPRVAYGIISKADIMSKSLLVKYLKA